MLLWEIPTMGESEMSDFENKELRITATGESVMVTKEEVDKARADYNAAADAACDAAIAADAAADPEFFAADDDDVIDAAARDAALAAVFAWKKYTKLKRQYEYLRILGLTTEN
jgi:hypothetical protein